MLNERETKHFWPNLTEDQKRELTQLKAALSRPLDTPVTWTSIKQRIVYEGPWRVQAFKNFAVTKEYSLEEKRFLRQSVVARLYQGLMGTPAEIAAQSIINRYSTPPKPEPSR